MAYAIIQTGGKQLRVEPGRFYDVERLAVDEDTQLTIDYVLFVDQDGEASVGQPLVEGATVEATVLRHFRGRKIIVYKMRPKKKTRKKQGHRQELTRLMINSISLNGSVIASDADAVDSSEDYPENALVEADAVEADAIEVSAVEADAVEADAVEVSAIEADAVEAVEAEADAVEEADAVGVQDSKS